MPATFTSSPHATLILKIEKKSSENPKRLPAKVSGGLNSQNYQPPPKTLLSEPRPVRAGRAGGI